MNNFDLLVIGSGPAGGQVASECAASGWSVAIAESRSFGGTCALRGCNPKKVLVHAAEVVDAARRSDGKLCDSGNIKIDWPQLLQFKNNFVKDVPNSSRSKFEDKGIKTFLESPQFISPTKLKIGSDVIEPKQVLIATGAKPRDLDIAGAEHVITSDEFMNLEEMPRRVLFVGGGYISFEFAHVATRAGASVTVLERGDRPLKAFEPSIVDRLVSKTEELGIDFRVQSEVKHIEKIETSRFVVEFETDGNTVEIETDLVVHGAGRVPNIDDLNLQGGEVEFSDSGIVVDKQLYSTTNPIVMAAGDCASTGAAPLTPTASTDGFTAAHNLLNETKRNVSYGSVPAVVFTIPSVASIGMTESDAERSGHSFSVNEGDMSDWGSVKKICESTAGYKILIDKDSQQIVGAHLIGPAAGEMINVFAIAMKAELTIEQLKSTLLAFPTSTYNLRQMI